MEDSIKVIEKGIQEAISEYYKNGPRSNKKLIPLHSAISNQIRARLEEYGCEGSCYSLPGKEITVQGQYYKKRVDICVKKGNVVLGVVSIKFVMSNYAQNANNYFENAVGELYNMNRRGILQWYVLIAFDEIPYYDVNKEIKRYEKINKESCERYNILKQDKLLDCLSIMIVSNGKILEHPNKKPTVNEKQFEVINCYPEAFETSLTHFCSEISKRRVWLKKKEIKKVNTKVETSE